LVIVTREQRGCSPEKITGGEGGAGRDAGLETDKGCYDTFVRSMGNRQQGGSEGHEQQKDVGEGAHVEQ